MDEHMAIDEGEARAEMMTAEPMPELEQLCNVCRGSGRGTMGGEGPRRPCGACGGAGYLPTPIGERFLSLMRHQFRPLYREMKQDY
jgi:hypothetical protein